MSEYIPATELAEYLNINRSTLRRWLLQFDDYIDTKMVDGSKRVHESSVANIKLIQTCFGKFMKNEDIKTLLKKGVKSLEVSQVNENFEKVFNYSGKQVRTAIENDTVWFVAKDVCDILGLSNVSKSLMALDDRFKTTLTISYSGSNYKTSALAINEPGLYKLIFRSRKEEAENFSDWLAEKVLPTIRKTGGYVANDELFVSTYLKHADEQTKLMFKATLETVRKQNEQITTMTPKAEYFDALVDRNLLTNFRDTAKELHLKQGEFIDWLLEKKFVYRDAKDKLKPYMQHVPSLFELKEWERNSKAGTQTLITPKGRETFRLLLKKKKA